MTSVINATAAAVIERARDHPKAIGSVLAAENGILGVLENRLVDTGALSGADLDAMAHTPGGVFGSCRFDLDEPADNPAQYARLFEVFRAHNVRYFLYNGGNGSMDTVEKLSAQAAIHGHDMVCLGLPKTIDNDLVGTDTSPGFGSAAKYLATSFRECMLDLASMTGPNRQAHPRLFVMEVMGRNTGWLAAACGLATPENAQGPGLLVLPECPLDEAALPASVTEALQRFGYCALAVSEGARNAEGVHLVEKARDAEGHVQLGGAGLWLGAYLARCLHVPYHVAVPDYMQRASGHLRSETDFTQARAVGKAAVDLAVAGHDAVMCAIVREHSTPYRWHVAPVSVSKVARIERRVPPAFLDDSGFRLSEMGRNALLPLIQGEVPVCWNDGLPSYPSFSFPRA
jgi:ATP-dependent phosphofructokinase / diphosphate-dependent phosphofructokinase